MLVGLIGSLLIGAFFWLFPIEIIQHWARQRAGADEFSQFEADEASAAMVWLIRCASLVTTAVFSALWASRRRSVPFLAMAMVEFWQLPARLRPRGAVCCFGLRILLIAWLLLAGSHALASIQRRLWEWPVYRLYSGDRVLPNISGSNREVIQYLKAATPPGSRILVLSDQKLFFLSYYLLPRRVYHPTHPDSEFVIAQAHNQRQMAAYRLSDLAPDRIARLKPDYILEYFEGDDFVRGEDLTRDAAWIRFQKGRNGAEWRPGYLVSLRQVKR